jgi:hypothetical protein
VRIKYAVIFSIMMLLLLIIPKSPNASENELTSRDEVFQYLESAYLAQISLSDEDRTMEEIHLLLNPYFSEEYKKIFLDANLVEENGKFTTYGTDFGQYYIPIHRFSNQTNVVIQPNQIYIFEYFQKNHEGPVGYDNHYEGILISKFNGEWKISKYLYNQIPEEIINKVEKKKIGVFIRKISHRFSLIL